MNSEKLNLDVATLIDARNVYAVLPEECALPFHVGAETRKRIAQFNASFAPNAKKARIGESVHADTRFPDKLYIKSLPEALTTARSANLIGPKGDSGLQVCALHHHTGVDAHYLVNSGNSRQGVTEHMVLGKASKCDFLLQDSDNQECSMRIPWAITADSHFHYNFSGKDGSKKVIKFDDMYEDARVACHSATVQLYNHGISEIAKRGFPHMRQACPRTKAMTVECALPTPKTLESWCVAKLGDFLTPLDFATEKCQDAPLTIAWSVVLEHSTIVPQKMEPFVFVFAKTLKLEPGEAIKLSVGLPSVATSDSTE